MSTESFVRLESAAAYELVYRWTLDDRPWQFRSRVPKQAVRSARERSRSIPRCYREAMTSSVTATVAGRLADDLSTLESTWERLRVVTRFVQSRRYQEDRAATDQVEYPKYVAETLVDNGSDCEDFAVLLAGLLSELSTDYDPVLVFYHDHVGVGIDPATVGEPADEAADPLVTAGDQSYLYAEVTTTLPVGTVPDPYRNEDVLAVYDGGWRYVDVETVGEEVYQALSSGALIDPRLYL